MCGIAGLVLSGLEPSDKAEAAIRRMIVGIKHRGPDDDGYQVLSTQREADGVAAIANTRLAILDLSPLGHQPMHDPETGNWIVHNGEIYNFRDIRTDLQRLGTTFVSHSDTEVVLKAYARWGEECLAKFRGMFAFALWDARLHRLFVARDPMGIKPLYYAETGSYFIFASEVRTLLGTGLVPPRLDPAGLINYLAFGSSY